MSTWESTRFEDTAVERAWRAFRWHVGSGIFRIGERITSLGEGVRSGEWDTSREQCWRDGHEFGLGMGLGDPEAAHWIEVEAQRRRLEEQRAAKV